MPRISYLGNGAAPEIQSYNGNAECFLALKQGKVDAFTQDSIIIAGVSGKEGVDYEAIGGIYSPSLYSIGVPNNDSLWRDTVSFTLQDLMKNGKYDEIYDAWFGEDGKFPLAFSVKPVLSDVHGDGVLYTWPN